MMSRNLCLAGMMGAGKTTVGRLLGEILSRRVADTDQELARWTGTPIPELFAERGEAGFRELEGRVVAELATYHDLVIALGGGVVLDDGNVTALRLTGVIVHLDAPPEVLAARLEDESAGRPLLAGDDPGTQLRQLHDARRARYLEVADTRVDATGSPETVAQRVLAWTLVQGDVLTPSEHEQVMA